MTQVHIAIFRWKDDANPAELSNALQMIAGLADKVSGIIEISVAENESRYNEGYTHVVMVRGETPEAIDAYRVHPDHIKAAAVIEAAEDHGIGVDFGTAARTETP